MGDLSRPDNLKVIVNIKRIVVTGCPRSGTGYTARLFQAVGLDVGHEKWGERGICSWKVAADPLDDEDLIIVNQYRHPLDVIGSMQTIGAGSWARLHNHTRCGTGDDKILSGMIAYIEWNMRAFNRCLVGYRVEDMENIWPILCQLLGYCPLDFPEIPTDINSRTGKYEPIQWDDLESRSRELTNEIMRMASNLGYEIT